jgi:hypothetical protein
LISSSEYIFGIEDFESGDLGSFTYENTWGGGTVVFDSNSKIEGVYSASMVQTEEGSASLYKGLGSGYETLFVQYKINIPSDFAFGSGTYFVTLDLLDSEDGERQAFTLEDWDNLRLTTTGDYGWNDTGITFVPGNTYTLEMKVVKKSTGGEIKVWVNNFDESNPNFTTGSTNTGDVDISNLLIGSVYADDSHSIIYIDDVAVSDSFIGELIQTVPTNFQWSGYNWTRRDDNGGPMYNERFSKSNVIGPDENDSIILRIYNPTISSPSGAEFYSNLTGWGYGTYTAVVSTTLDTLPNSSVFGGMFLYDSTNSPTYGEIDIGEVSDYGIAESPVLTQVYYYENATGDSVFNSSSVLINANETQTYRLIWTPGSLVFDTFAGVGTSGATILHSEFDLNISEPNNEKVHFNFWVYDAGNGGADIVPTTEIILSNFTFVEYSPPVDTIPPTINITSPKSQSVFTTNSILISITTNEASTCNYSLDSFVTNSSLPKVPTDSTNKSFQKYINFDNGNYNIKYSCSDNLWNINSSVSINFVVAVPWSSGGGGGSSTIPYEELNEMVNETEENISISNYEDFLKDFIDEEKAKSIYDKIKEWLKNNQIIYFILGILLVFLILKKTKTI